MKDKNSFSLRKFFFGRSNGSSLSVREVILGFGVGALGLVIGIIAALIFFAKNVWAPIKNYILNKITWKRQVLLAANAVLALTWLYKSGCESAAETYFFISILAACILILWPVVHNYEQKYGGGQSD
jgi:hypothetical protein